MKRILFLVALLNFSSAFSQCTIMGADHLQVGERQVYNAINSEAECESSYQWTYLDQKIILEGDTQKKDLTLKGAVPGTALLSLEIKTKNGKEKCEKMIKVFAPTGSVLSNDKQNCDIKVSSWKEIRTSDTTVVFEPLTPEIYYAYNWTVYYRGGDKKVSSDQKPQFNYSKEHAIDKVEMEIVFDRCSKKITKSYDTNFWYFF